LTSGLITGRRRPPQRGAGRPDRLTFAATDAGGLSAAGRYDLATIFEALHAATGAVMRPATLG
jgi:hypothetical protein